MDRLTCARLPGAEAIVTGDLASLQQMRSVAEEVNALEPLTSEARSSQAAQSRRRAVRLETAHTEGLGWALRMHYVVALRRGNGLQVRWLRPGGEDMLLRAALAGH